MIIKLLPYATHIPQIIDKKVKDRDYIFFL